MYKRPLYILLVVFISITLLGCSKDETSSCEGDDCPRNGSNIETPACQEECAGDTPFCLEDTGECVECLSGSDCGENESCVDNTCVPDVGCTENTDCSGDTPYCLLETGECVQCIEDTDCGGEEACQDNLCTSSAGCVDRPLEGFGADTQGGAGGDEIVVTNLDDSGPGSLREALSGSNRTITFDVGGEILVNSTLYIRGRSYITIDGSTAPSPGITITAANSSVDSALVYIRDSHDIIMRHIRISDAPDPDTGDNLRINDNNYNIVIDHCSFRRAADGNFDISADSHDITVQWCIIADTVKNQLIRTNVDNLSLHHNLYVHGDERNPQFQENTTDFDFVNNVLFDWSGNYGIRIREGSSGNLAKNYFQPGDRSDASDTIIITNDAGDVYCEGNVLPSGGSCTSSVDERFEAPTISEMTAEEAYDAVLEEAGACPRDAEDEEYVDDVINNIGL